MKDFLKKLMQARTDRLNQIRSKIEASTDVNEVRSLTSEATQLNDEIRDLQQQIDAIEAEEQRKANNPVPEDAKLVNGNVKGSFKADKRDEDPANSM